jgi:hypothetical protein
MNASMPVTLFELPNFQHGQAGEEVWKARKPADREPTQRVRNFCRAELVKRFVRTDGGLTVQFQQVVHPGPYRVGESCAPQHLNRRGHRMDIHRNAPDHAQGRARLGQGWALGTRSVLAADSSQYITPSARRRLTR